MLIELWEKIRGYDKWIRTEAKLGQSEFERTAYRRKEERLYAYRFEQCLEWVDQQGQSRSARFRVPDGSLLFPRSDGDRVVIRYDPANPENYYFPLFSQSSSLTNSL